MRLHGMAEASIVDLGGIQPARRPEHYFLMFAAIMQARGNPNFNIRLVVRRAVFASRRDKRRATLGNNRSNTAARPVPCQSLLGRYVSGLPPFLVAAGASGRRTLSLAPFSRATKFPSS
jgi:hypothetical protein